MTARAPVSETTRAKRRIAANLRWSFEPDRAAATAPGRQAFLDRFEHIVDPNLVLDPAERAKRAQNFRTAYFADLGLKSAAARRARSAKS